MVNTQERNINHNNNSSANVNEIEQLKKGSSTTSTSNNSVGSTSSTTSSSSNSTALNSSSSSAPPPTAPHHLSESSSETASVKSSTNFAKNASAQANKAGNQQTPHKLIPIQSVLHTGDHHQHYNQQHHHTHHNSSLNHSSANLQLQQSGTTSHLNAHTSTLQQFLSGNNSNEGATATNNQLPSELPQEDEERLGKLFTRLDRDGNGRIDIHDLSEALREFGLSSVYAEVSLKQIGEHEFMHVLLK